jgi:hypothetical protein
VSILEKILCKYVKYKFIFNNDIKHSSYLYQKVFRSIYGYHQNVTKKDKKVYTYFRKGVVSDIPYIRPGKNSIIIPIGKEQKLIDFFETGINPTHRWKDKGDWKVNCEINNIEIDLKSIVLSLEEYIDNIYMISNNNTNIKINDNLINILKEQNININENKYLLEKIESIINLEWFLKSKKYSTILSNFYNNYLLLKQKISNN